VPLILDRRLVQRSRPWTLAAVSRQSRGQPVFVLDAQRGVVRPLHWFAKLRYRVGTYFWKRSVTRELQRIGADTDIP
jgi:hypothetical protein